MTNIFVQKSFFYRVSFSLHSYVNKNHELFWVQLKRVFH